MLASISSSLSSLFSAQSGEATPAEPPLYDRVYDAYLRIVTETVSPFLTRHISLTTARAVTTLLLEPCSVLRAVFTWPANWKEPFNFYNMNPTTLSKEQMSKPSILLLHGNGGNQSNLLGLGKALENSELGPVYTVNLPSGKITNRDFEIVQEKINEIRHQHSDKIHLVGHSRGGTIALDALEKWPDFIGKVVTIGAVGWSNSYKLSSRVCQITGKYDRILLAWSILHNRHEVDTGHVGLIYSPQTHKHVIEWLKS